MKALFVNPTCATYGSERSMLALLGARQFHAEVVCPPGGPLEQELNTLRIKVHPLEFTKYSFRQNPFWHLAFYHRFRITLRMSKSKVVVINLDGNTPWITLAAVRAGIPVVRICRFEFQPPSRWLDRWCWLQAKAIICPSDYVKQQVLAWLPPHFHCRLHRLYDPYAGRAVAPVEVSAFRQQFRLGSDKLIGYIGRISRAKRIEVAIQALAKARHTVSNARLLIVGAASSSAEISYLQELRRLTVALGISGAVTFIGFLPAEQILAAIAALDACVLPSEAESFGMVLIEAWAQGVPTVTSDIGGCSEISKASGGGVLFRVGDVETAAGHLVALLQNRSAAADMGQKGRSWVALNCNITRYADCFQAVFACCR